MVVISQANDDCGELKGASSCGFFFRRGSFDRDDDPGGSPSRARGKLITSVVNTIVDFFLRVALEAINSTLR